LKLFEQKVKHKWEQIDHLNKIKFSLRFQALEGNINYISHIYNLAIQAGHTAVKVNAKGKEEIRHAFERSTPEFPEAKLDSTGRLALFRMRSMIHKFRRCREYREWLV
jgi:hypothetical protein